MAIRKSKINIDTEERSDNMMNDVENEVEEQQAEEIAAGGGRYRLKKVGVTASEKVFERGDPVEDVDALVRFEFDGLAV